MVLPRGAQHSDDGGDVGIVPAVTDGDVVGAGEHGVGGVELQPARVLAAPDAAASSSAPFSLASRRS